MRGDTGGSRGAGGDIVGSGGRVIAEPESGNLVVGFCSVTLKFQSAFDSLASVTDKNTRAPCRRGRRFPA